MRDRKTSPFPESMDGAVNQEVMDNERAYQSDKSPYRVAGVAKPGQRARGW